MGLGGVGGTNIQVKGANPREDFDFSGCGASCSVAFELIIYFQGRTPRQQLALILPESSV